jgi:hypothetical protein
MQTQDYEKPNSSNSMTDYFLYTERKRTLTFAANTYSKYTGIVDGYHADKAKLVKNCSEAMLFAAWTFVFFLIFFVILKLTASGVQ